MKKYHKHNWVSKEDKTKYCSSCGAKKGIDISFYNGYGGGSPKCEVKFDGTPYVIEIDQIETLLKRLIDIYGYKIEKTNRQKYPRMIINSI